VSGGATIERYADLAQRILGRPSDRSRLIAVDGPGGSGKTLFAERLAAGLDHAPVVQTDDFATGEPGDEWWPRLRSQVIEPLVEGRPAHYQRYDWDRGTFAEWREIQPAPALIIEGVSSARRAAADVLDLAVWVHAPRATRLARGLDRDGEGARPDWERWMAEEDVHFRRDRTIDRCGVLVDGAASVPHDREREFVRLDSCSYE
jgi:uridine kinase